MTTGRDVVEYLKRLEPVQDMTAEQVRLVGYLGAMTLYICTVQTLLDNAGEIHQMGEAFKDAVRAALQ